MVPQQRPTTRPRRLMYRSLKSPLVRQIVAFTRTELVAASRSIPGSTRGHALGNNGPTRRLSWTARDCSERGRFSQHRRRTPADLPGRRHRTRFLLGYARAATLS